MGVVQVTKSRRTQLPPGQTGQVKPPFSLADRSGEQAAFRAVTSVAGGILNKTIQAQENEQVSTFEGSYDSEVVKFSGLIRANPGASEQQVQKWMQEANANIGRAGAIPTNRNARRRVRNTIRQNLPAFQERMQANWSAIESKRMLDNFNDDIEFAVQDLDKIKVDSLVTGASGNLVDPEQKDRIIERANRRIDKLAEVAARQGQAVIEETQANSVYEEARSMPQADGFARILLEPDEDVRRIAKARLTEYHRIRREVNLKEVNSMLSPTATVNSLIADRARLWSLNMEPAEQSAADEQLLARMREIDEGVDVFTPNATKSPLSRQ